MAYSKISTRASEYLSRQLNYPDEKKEILAYGLENLIFTSLGLLAIILVGWVLQVGQESLAAIIAGATLRKFSGGSHRATALGCIVFGAVTYPPAAWLAHFMFESYGPLGLLPASLLGLVILLTVNYYAPVDSPGKPIVSPEFKKRLHRASVFVAALFILLALALGKTSLGLAIFAGLLLQTVSLLPIFNIRR